MSTLELSSNRTRLLYTSDGTQDAELRRIGARRIGASNVWHLPNLYASIMNLKRSFGEIGIGKSVEDSGLLNPYGFPSEPVEAWTDKLFKYQNDAIEFLVNSPHHGSLLALSPGLGKTLTAIGASQVLKFNRVLVIAPLSLIHNWIVEIHKWAGIQATDSHSDVPMEPTGWFVTNYETVVSHIDSYLKQRFDLIIVDESIMVKNRNAQRSEAIKALSRNARKVWLLSGSPVSRYADDLYMQLSILKPEAFSSYWRFANTYCFIEKTIWGDKVAGTRPNIDFREEFKDLMFVRNQRDVLPELPEVLFETYELQMHPDQNALYHSMKKNFLLELESGTLTASTKLAQLTRLQQIVSCPSVFQPGISSCKLEMLRNLLDNATLPLPAIIWVNYKTTATEIQADLTKHYPDLAVRVVTGETEFRKQIFEDFQMGKVDILILSIGVGKFGLTLTTAQSAVYYDKTFDGDAYVQSLARIHRIGLDHSPVVISLKVARTTDVLIEMNLSGKIKSINAISNNDLATLIKGLK